MSKKKRIPPQVDPRPAWRPRWRVLRQRVVAGARHGRVYRSVHVCHVVRSGLGFAFRLQRDERLAGVHRRRLFESRLFLLCTQSGSQSPGPLPPGKWRRPRGGRMVISRSAAAMAPLAVPSAFHAQRVAELALRSRGAATGNPGRRRANGGLARRAAAVRVAAGVVPSNICAPPTALSGRT